MAFDILIWAYYFVITEVVDSRDRQENSGPKTASLLCLQSEQNDGKSHPSQNLVSVPVWAMPYYLFSTSSLETWESNP